MIIHSNSPLSRALRSGSAHFSLVLCVMALCTACEPEVAVHDEAEVITPAQDSLSGAQAVDPTPRVRAIEAHVGATRPPGQAASLNDVDVIDGEAILEEQPGGERAEQGSIPIDELARQALATEEGRALVAPLFYDGSTPPQSQSRENSPSRAGVAARTERRAGLAPRPARAADPSALATADPNTSADPNDVFIDPTYQGGSPQGAPRGAGVAVPLGFYGEITGFDQNATPLSGGDTTGNASSQGATSNGSVIGQIPQARSAQPAAGSTLPSQVPAPSSLPSQVPAGAGAASSGPAVGPGVSGAGVAGF